MNSFPSTIWDRLFPPPGATPDQSDPTRLSLAQYKFSLARDLEALLNTRIGICAEQMALYPACADSILNYGLSDFADLCMTSSEDRKELCDRITAAIARHEPRLVDVRAALLEDTGGIVNRLNFAISGQLRVLAGDDRVQFDVMLEPPSLHYSIV
jgi:type VI secretion system protein ImpF